MPALAQADGRKHRTRRLQDQDAAGPLAKTLEQGLPNFRMGGQHREGGGSRVGVWRAALQSELTLSGTETEEIGWISGRGAHICAKGADTRKSGAFMHHIWPEEAEIRKSGACMHHIRPEEAGIRKSGAYMHHIWPASVNHRKSGAFMHHIRSAAVNLKKSGAFLHHMNRRPAGQRPAGRGADSIR